MWLELTVFCCKLPDPPVPQAFNLLCARWCTSLLCLLCLALPALPAVLLQEKEVYERELKYHTLVHESLIQFYRGFRHDAHPMAIMCSVVGALSAFYPEVAEVK